MACDKTLLTQAYLDGELDPPSILAIEAHLEICAECRKLLADTTALREGMRGIPARVPAPAALARRIDAMLDQADGKKTGRLAWLGFLGRWVGRYRQWLSGAVSGAAVAAAVAVAVIVLLPSEHHDLMVDELTNAHRRSLMPAHLVDMASSDEKTLAPWLERQAEMPAPVVDLQAQGFDLEGGRTDMIDGRRVGVVVYRQGDHVVNLFVWSRYEMDHASMAERDGFNLFMWPQHNLAFCAVSDLGETELRTLARGVNAGMATESR